MKISQIEQNDFEHVLLLNADSVPHVNLINKDELQWFVDNAACAVAVTIEQRFAAFMIGLRPGTTYGSANYRWFCDNYDDFAYVDRIAVAEWARRRGVADELYRYFQESESDAPVMTCEVNSRPANEGSMRFHKKMGFREVGRQEVENGKKEVALLEKKIEQ